MTNFESLVEKMDELSETQQLMLQTLQAIDRTLNHQNKTAKIHLEITKTFIEALEKKYVQQ